eukprot:TRINITY_DN8230_c0_g1_i1.p1 TRINITY_DN8230_c0_g1~~TRINITY_DN8230_c0_g1_i1.p1  ORF type:complete len:312 (+),score=35.47 TRINITY_DN8230_c0_g1_i1:77-1012(+)
MASAHHGSMTATPSWKAYAGRSQGKEGYRVGDVTRHFICRFLSIPVPKSRWLCFSRQEKSDRAFNFVEMRSEKGGSKEKRSQESRLGSFSGDTLSWFGICGANLSLVVDIFGSTSSSTSSLPCRRCVVASRRNEASLDNVAILASVPNSTTSSVSASCDYPFANFSYGFKFEILELNRSRDALSVGVILDSPWSFDPSQPLARSAQILPRALTVGGNPSHWYFDGRKIAEAKGWRPARDLKVGSVVEIVVEATDDTLHLFLSHNGRLRTETRVKRELSQHPWAFTSFPRGVVDVCGTVQSIRLLGQRLLFR